MNTNIILSQVRGIRHKMSLIIAHIIVTIYKTILERLPELVITSPDW